MVISPMELVDSTVSEHIQEKQKRATTIVFANHKGGVAKTTSTVMAAQIYASSGLKVLVLDVDSQGNVSEALCPKGLSPMELPSIDICLADASKSRLCAVQSCFDGILLIPSSISMERPFPSFDEENHLAERSGPSAKGGFFRKTPARRERDEPVPFPLIYRIPLGAVSAIVDELDSYFDVVLVDTAPSLGLATQSALRAADYIVLPCSPARHAIFGLPDMLELAGTISCAPSGVLVTLADNRTRLDNIGRQHLMAKFNCLGEVPKISRIADNIAVKRNVLSRIDSAKAKEIEDLFMKILQEARSSLAQLPAAGSGTL